MRAIDPYISFSDMFELLQKISYDEDKTVDKLLQSTVSDLKGDRSIVNLKALNYFLLYRNNCKEIHTYPYENVVKESLCLLKNISDKDSTIGGLLGSVIKNSLPLIKKDKLNNVFAELVDFVRTNLCITREKVLYQANYYANLTPSLEILEKLCIFVSINSLNNLKFPCTLTETLVNLISELTLDESRKKFVSVLPKYIFSQESNLILEQIWLQLLRLDSNENDIGKQLFYICLFGDSYISVSNSKHSFPLFDDPKFWLLVQKGLYNEDSLIRKQALYIFKRYIEILQENGQDIKQDHFYWDDKHKFQLTAYWNKIIILLEVIEEKQTHLITPALQNFNDLLILCSVNEKVCYSWLYCVFIRLLKHPSHIIVKWSLKEFCNIDVNFLFNDVKFKELLNCFFNSLNNMFLFNSESYSDFNHEDFLEKWFTSITVKDTSGKSFEHILEHLACISWSSIPLFYIMNAISRVPSKSLLNVNCFSHLKKILVITLKNQSIFIRSCIQCRLLKCICQLSNNDVDIMTITNILGSFSSDESLKRGSDIWDKCVEWIARIPSNEISVFLNLCSDRIFKKYKIQQSYSISSFARMFVLITDSNKFSIEGNIKIILDKVFEQFLDCDKRIYSCSKVQDNCLTFLECLISECRTFPHNKEKHKLLKLLEHHIPNLLCYIEVRLQKGPIESLPTASLYERTLNGILSSDYFGNSAPVEVLNLFNTVLYLLTINIAPFHEYLTIKIAYHYYNFLLKRSNILKNIVYEEEIVNYLFKKRLFNKDLKNIILAVDPMFNMRGKLMSDIMHTLWCTFTLYLKNIDDINSVLKIFPISMLFEFAFDAINEDGKQSLIPILKSFVYLLPFYKNVTNIKQFILATWNACFELRKNELFWPAISEWIRMVYQNKIAENSDYHELINDYANKIMQLGEDLTGLVDIFVDHCRNLTFIPAFSAILSNGLVFGTILRKDKRMEVEVCHFILKLINTGSIESFGSGQVLKTDREVRLKILSLILTSSNVEYRNQLIVCIVNELLLHDSDLAKNNKRYFNDSYIHRKKNKLLQALLMIENFIFLNSSHHFQELPKVIYNWLLQSLINSSQQPSIRYQLEWLFVRLNIHYPMFLDLFWDYFNKAGNERLGSMCSFISIAYHLSMVLNNNQFLEQCIDNILPWCMSQNFNIRLYAQVLLSKLWNLNPEIAKKYHCITKNQLKIYDQEGNMLTNAKKMENDFYFSVFHPINHFNLQTIYWDLPRLSNISVEEWIHPDLLKNYAHLCTQSKPVDLHQSLESCVAPTWIIKNSGGSNDKTDGSSIQKKFIPWKAMFHDQDEENNHQKGGMILVASLVEKAANLGGLARTCEVFATKELVVSNMDVTKEKEFMSLSMTAEKHMNITEVKVHNLPEYLKAMKNMGYLLIGAEQTTGSVSLTSYRFPDHCVLVLGSEKEGIPPNLLPLLEAYIEIPQLGLVRSLNVHVTGAIFLWEYSKQHSFNTR